MHHPPSYRSDLLIKFIKKLDIRVEATIELVNPSIERQLALPKVLPISKFARDCTIMHDGDNAEGDCELTTIDYNDSDSSCDILSQYS